MTMKKLLFTIALILASVAGFAQVLPPGGSISLRYITEEDALNKVKSLFEGKDVDYYIGSTLMEHGVIPMNAMFNDNAFSDTNVVVKEQIFHDIW